METSDKYTQTKITYGKQKKNELKLDITDQKLVSKPVFVFIPNINETDLNDLNKPKSSSPKEFKVNIQSMKTE